MISVELPEDMERDLNERKEKGYYSSLAEVVREALREYLNDHQNPEFTDKEKFMLRLVESGKVSRAKTSAEHGQEIQDRIESARDGEKLYTLEEAREELGKE